MRLKKDKSGDTVGRPSWRSSLPGDPGAEFFCEKPQHMKNSLNFANTCLKVVDTRRFGYSISSHLSARRKIRKRGSRLFLGFITVVDSDRPIIPLFAHSEARHLKNLRKPVLVLF